MEIIKKTIICDCCKLEKITQKVKYPVLFLTEQTEGRSVKPYISYHDLDLCKECLQNNIGIRGVGAQGYNEYQPITNTSNLWEDFEIEETK